MIWVSWPRVNNNISLFPTTMDHKDSRCSWQKLKDILMLGYKDKIKQLDNMPAVVDIHNDITKENMTWKLKLHITAVDDEL